MATGSTRIEVGSYFRTSLTRLGGDSTDLGDSATGEESKPAVAPKKPADALPGHPGRVVFLDDIAYKTCVVIHLKVSQHVTQCPVAGGPSYSTPTSGRRSCTLRR